MIKVLKVLVALLCMATAFPISAQRNDYGELVRHKVELSGMIASKDLYVVDLGYHFKVNQYIGVGGSFGIFKQFDASDWAYGDGWTTDRDYRQASKLYFRPSVQFFTPMLFSTGGAEWRAYAEPGVMLYVPYDRIWIDQTDGAGMPVEETAEKVSANGGRWCAPDCKAGIMVRFDNVSIAVGGYGAMLDVYSQHRRMRYNGVSFSASYPKCNSVWGLYASFSYNF